MPMIDVYATAGTFGDTHALARDLAGALMTIERVPDIAMFRKNTAAFVHDLPASSLANVDGDSTYVRVQVLTNAGALDREKQLEVVERLTAIVAEAAGDPSLADRTWVLLTEAPDGGWGLAGHANTNAELVAAARAQIAEIQGNRQARDASGAEQSVRTTLRGSPVVFGREQVTDGETSIGSPPIRQEAHLVLGWKVIESVDPRDCAPQGEVAGEEHIGPVERHEQETVGRPRADPRNFG